MLNGSALARADIIHAVLAGLRAFQGCYESSPHIQHMHEISATQWRIQPHRRKCSPNRADQLGNQSRLPIHNASVGPRYVKAAQDDGTDDS